MIVGFSLLFLKLFPKRLVLSLDFMPFSLKFVQFLEFSVYLIVVNICLNTFCLSMNDFNAFILQPMLIFLSLFFVYLLNFRDSRFHCTGHCIGRDALILLDIAHNRQDSIFLVRLRSLNDIRCFYNFLNSFIYFFELFKDLFESFVVSAHLSFFDGSIRAEENLELWMGALIWPRAGVVGVVWG